MARKVGCEVIFGEGADGTKVGDNENEGEIVGITDGTIVGKNVGDVVMLLGVWMKYVFALPCQLG